MEKFSFETIVIEVTRKCNMSCAHCLRGNVQNKDINFEYITMLLEKCERIETLTFSGGEPSLNVPAIRFTLNELKRLNIPVNMFYIATNGSKSSGNMDFIMLLMELYLYQEADLEEYGAMVNISSDIYHNHNDESVMLLKTLRFVELRDEGKDYTDGAGLIYEGRATENFSNGRQLYGEKWIMDYDNHIEGTVYLNTEGFMFDNCNLSYDNQDYGCHNNCHITDFDDYIADLFEKELEPLKKAI